MCAYILFDNYYFIKNQTKYLTVFIEKSVKKQEVQVLFLTKKIAARLAQNPKTRLSVSILIIQTHIMYNKPSFQPYNFTYVTTPN